MGEYDAQERKPEWAAPHWRPGGPHPSGLGLHTVDATVPRRPATNSAVTVY